MHRLLLMVERGFRNIDTDQRSDEATGDSVESARCHNVGTGCSQQRDERSTCQEGIQTGHGYEACRCQQPGKPSDDTASYNPLGGLFRCG